METPNYIKSLVTPTTKQPQGRKVWSIDLQTVWLPFFTATNAMGDTAIPSDAISCPFRLGYDKAGAVRFSQAGRPVVRVAKEIADNVRMVRDNFTANLINYAGQVAKDNTESYKAQLEQAGKFGSVIANYDKNQLSLALQRKAEAEAERQAEADKQAKAEAVKQAVTAVKENGHKAKVTA